MMEKIKKNKENGGNIYSNMKLIRETICHVTFFSVMSCFVFMCERPPRSYVFEIIKKKHINLLK